MKVTFYIFLIGIHSMAMFNAHGHDADSSSISTLMQIESLMKVANKENDSTKVIALNDLAYIYFYINPDSTYKYALEALKTAEKVQFTKGIANAKRLIGITYRSKNEHKKAIDWLRQALLLAEEINYKEGIGDILNSIGVSFSNIEDWDQALDYYFRSLKYQKFENNDLKEALLYINIGECMLNKKLLDSAQYYYNVSEEIFSKTKNPKWLSMVYCEMGNLYIEKENLSLALKYSKKAEELAELSGQKRQLQKAYINQAKVFFKRKYFTSAGDYAHRSLQLAEETGMMPFMVDSYDILYKIYLEKGDYKKALDYHLKLIKYQDTLKVQNDYSEKNLLNFQLELEKAQKENILLRNEKELQVRNIQKRNIFAVAVFVCLILVAILAYVFFRLRQKEIIVNTRLKNTNNELAEQKEEMKATLQMVEVLNAHLQAQNNTINQIAIVSITDAEGNIISVNDNFCNLTGYSRSELLSKKHNILKSNLLNVQQYKKIWKDISGGKTWRGELCGENKEGKPFWVDTAIAPIIDDDHQAKQFFSLQFEISERKNYEAQIKNKSQELSEMNKLKDKLLSVVSHDFRGPLNSLRGTLSLYLQGAIKNEEMKMLAKDIVEKLDNTYNLLENLLNWAKSQMQGMKVYQKEIDLEDITSDCLQLLQPLAEKKLVILTNNIMSSVKVFADNEMIKLVVRNLISNAIKFTDAGDKITIDAVKEEDHVIVSIKDTGMGISNEKQDRIFNFENITTKGTANETGIGLGLLLCKDFVERNNGKLWFESELGKGSTFFFSLPYQS